MRHDLHPTITRCLEVSWVALDHIIRKYTEGLTADQLDHVKRCQQMVTALLSELDTED
jgi:hypothetical protein